MNVPILESERLRLRGHTAEDYPRCCALWADAEVVRFLCKPLTAEETWSRLLRYGGLWDLLGFGFWVVEEKETGVFVGEIGFCDYKRDLDPPLGATPEMGWVLASSQQGKGYATEVVRMLLGWAKLHLPSGGVACLINPENAASLRVAEKCGFRISHSAQYRESAVLVLRATLR